MSEARKEYYGEKKEGCTIHIHCGEKEHSEHHEHPCHCPAAEFSEVYSNKAQSLAASTGSNLAGGIVLFENLIVATSNIDASQAATSGILTINKSGWYDVFSAITGTLNPLQSPLPVWTFSLFVNGVIVPGSTFSDMTLSPDQQSNQVVADVYVHFNKGDKISVANTSVNPIQINSPTLGTNATPNSASLKLQMLKAD